MSTSSFTRALHWCLKIGNRPASIRFYRDFLNMTVLRHEEFDEGCKATCNGPYDNRWSKTMIGYGPETDHFILELTYNYTVNNYKLGNDYQGIVIESATLFDKVQKQTEVPYEKIGDELVVPDPDGYKVAIVSGDKNMVTKCRLNVKSLEESLKYWANTLGMTVVSHKDKLAQLSYGDNQALLELIEIGHNIDHKTGWGRLAFATPIANLVRLDHLVKKEGYRHLHDKIDLGTPGKATVTVIILLDPNGYEICFVGDEDFRILSFVDPNANEVLVKEISQDQSDQWYKISA